MKRKAHPAARWRRWAEVASRAAERCSWTGLTRESDARRTSWRQARGAHKSWWKHRIFATPLYGAELTDGHTEKLQDWFSEVFNEFERYGERKRGKEKEVEREREKMETACSTVKTIIPQGADNDALIVILSVSLVESLSNVTAAQKGKNAFMENSQGTLFCWWAGRNLWHKAIIGMQRHRQFWFPHDINFNKINCIFCRLHTSQTLESAAKYNTNKKMSEMYSFLSLWDLKKTLSLAFPGSAGNT